MDNYYLLTRILTSVSVVIPLVLTACFLFGWAIPMTVLALLASMIISCPATFAVHLFVWDQQKARFQAAIIWMLLWSSIPIGSTVAAKLFAPWVAGRTLPIRLLVASSSYVAVFANSVSLFPPVFQFNRS